MNILKIHTTTSWRTEQRNRANMHMSNETAKRAITVYGMTTFVKVRHFRMNKAVFMRIVDRLSENVQFFQQRRDAVGRLGLSPLQKCMAALRMLAYGCAADAVDEYL